jgi:hypothetical protein
MIVLSVLAIVFFAAGCIFSSNKDDGGGKTKIETVSDLLYGTWRSATYSGNYHTLGFCKVAKSSDEGIYTRINYSVDKEGNSTQIGYQIVSDYYIELKEDGYSEDIINLQIRVNGELTDSRGLKFSISADGKKLTLSGYTKIK